ncbi:MAG: GNAT family N-acetyltransferase [Lentisphaeria bacterium]|nr:GNAT family N-acetyltransferase [Lentisphaeria bacterium]
MVAPEHRRRGVGGAIVRALVAELRKRGVDWIGLVGEPGTEEFYRSLGFRAPENFTFWRCPADGE